MVRRVAAFLRAGGARPNAEDIEHLISRLFATGERLDGVERALDAERVAAERSHDAMQAAVLELQAAVDAGDVERDKWADLAEDRRRALERANARLTQAGLEPELVTERGPEHRHRLEAERDAARDLVRQIAAAHPEVVPALQVLSDKLAWVDDCLPNT